MSILIFLVVSAYTLLIYIVNASYERIGVRDQVFRAVKELTDVRSSSEKCLSMHDIDHWVCHSLY